jgi:cation diffusion facilitator family transporter
MEHAAIERAAIERAAMERGSRRAIIAALVANLAIAAAKLVGFAFTGAASMLAESVHSLADTTNQGLLFLGGSRAGRAASTEHPFGYGRERYFWGFVVALVIFTAGSMFALFEGVDKLRHPHELSSAPWAVAILLVSVGLEGFSFRTALREARPLKGAGSWWRFIRGSKTPELPVVLLEDFGALIGLALALVGIGLAELTGNARFDALGSIAIGILLGVIAVTLVVEMKSLLIGEAATPAMVAHIREAMEKTPLVLGVIHLRTQHLGPEELLVGAKLAFETTLDVFGLAEAIDDVERHVRAAVPEARMIYIEPDVARPAPTTGR